MQKNQGGFTLVELMVTLAVTAILAVLALNVYTTYVTRTYYIQIVFASESYKLGVIECYQKLGTLTGCNGGTNGIPANITRGTGSVRTITVTNGRITIVPVAANGILASDRYVLTPRLLNSQVIWTPSGAAFTKGYTK